MKIKFDLLLSMKTFYLKCKQDTDNKIPQVSKANKKRIILLSKCAVSNSKKIKFYEKTRSRGLLSNIKSKISLSKIPLLDI